MKPAKRRSPNKIPSSESKNGIDGVHIAVREGGHIVVDVSGWSGFAAEEATDKLLHEGIPIEFNLWMARRIFLINHSVHG